MWRRWSENAFAFYSILLAAATVATLVLPGTSKNERWVGVIVSALTALWFHRWCLLVRVDIAKNAHLHRVCMALIGVVLTSVLAIVHDAYLLVHLLLILHFFVELPVGWAVATAVLITFPSGRVWDTHGAISDPATDIVLVLFLRAPIVIVLGMTVRTAVAQNEERRRLLDTLALVERRAGVLEERQRLAREIHDTLAQGFAAILVHLAQEEASRMPVPASRSPHLVYAQSIARENLEEARRMMRALLPEVLELEVGLPAVMQRVTRNWSERSGVACELSTTGNVLALHTDLEVTLLRATQELLTNVGKHASATRVTVTLSYMPDIVVLDVCDDGVGFSRDTSAVECTVNNATREEAVSARFGLRGLHERAAQLNGTFAVESVHGDGATATLRIPVIERAAVAPIAAVRSS